MPPALRIALPLLIASIALSSGVMAGANSRDGCMNQWLFNGIWRVEVTGVAPYMNGSQQIGWQVTEIWRNGTSQELAPSDSVLKDQQLTLASGTLVLFGPSGAGKTVTVHALAGLLRPERGHVRIAGETVFDAARRENVPAHKRRIGYVPQHQSLFPFMDVLGNVGFGLARAERAGKDILVLMEELGILHLKRARPDDLSGGERQRVALARALAIRPRLLLLDEPFASIDHDGRAALRATLKDTLKRRDLPAVFVTHDPDDAIELGDSLVRFERGRTTEAGTPRALLQRGETVVLHGTPAGPPREEEGGRGVLRLEGATVEAPLGLLEPGDGGEVTLTLRTRPRARR